MSREIKFKFYIESSDGEEKGLCKAFTLEELIGSDDYFCKEDYLVFKKLQYTGLKDKNEVEIYEGDIIIDHDISKSPVEVCIGPYKNDADGLTHEGVYWQDSIYTCYMGVKDCCQYEIIGNIYENLELLETEDE